MSPFESFLSNALSIPLVKTVLSVLLVTIIVGTPIAIVKSINARKQKNKTKNEFQGVNDINTKTDD